MNNQPITIVIFGASGDLTERKLIPALFSLYQKNRLPEIRILGTSRSDFSNQGFRDHLLTGLQNFSPDPVNKTKLAEILKVHFLSTG